MGFAWSLVDKLTNYQPEALKECATDNPLIYAGKKATSALLFVGKTALVSVVALIEGIVLTILFPFSLLFSLFTWDLTPSKILVTYLTTDFTALPMFLFASCVSSPSSTKLLPKS